MPTAELKLDHLSVTVLYKMIENSPTILSVTADSKEWIHYLSGETIDKLHKDLTKKLINDNLNKFLSDLDRDEEMSKILDNIGVGHENM